MDDKELNKQIELLDEEELDDLKKVLNKDPQELTTEEKHFIESIFNKPFNQITTNEMTQLKVSINPLFKGLVELDTMLQKAVDVVDKAFDGFDNLKVAGEKYAQQKIDKACEQISDKINKTLDEKKKAVCKTLKTKYKKTLEVIETLKPIIDLIDFVKNLSLENIVEGVIKIVEVFVGPYIKPYKKAIKFIQEFTTQVIPLLQNITDNTQKLMETPDRAKDKINNINPKLNLNKLKISFTPPSIEDIIS